ncbi:MAG: DUF1638 domain-containing protein [Pseudomonadota bacterium]
MTAPPSHPPARRRGGRAARLAEGGRAAGDPGVLSDSDLAERQVELRKGSGETLVIACGALAREILALIEANGLSGLDVTCLPALLHNRPEQIPERVRATIRGARAAGYRRVLIGYGDCGTGGGLDRVCAEEGVERLPGAHCYAFFSGVAAFEGREEIDAFYLTDFLVRQFDVLVWRGMGLDRDPSLRAVYFKHYARVVYLAQLEDPALDRAARAAAERLGLAYEKRSVGYGDLAPALVAAAR